MAIEEKKPEWVILSGKGGSLLAKSGGASFRFTLTPDGLKIKEIAGGGVIQYKNFTLEDLWAASAGQKTLFDTTLEKPKAEILKN